MNPTLPEVLIGQAVALAAPQPPEASGNYMAARIGMVAMLATLAAQEAQRGPAARVWENAALRTLLGRAIDAYDGELSGRLAVAAATTDGDQAWSTLDAANAALRRGLIALQEAAEYRRDSATQSEILALFVEMARARHLDLPASLS